MRMLARPNSQGMLMRGGPDRWYMGVWGSNRDRALLRWAKREHVRIGPGERYGNYALVLRRGQESLHSVMLESPEVQPGPLTFALNEPVIQLLCPGPKATVANLALRSAVVVNQHRSLGQRLVRDARYETDSVALINQSWWHVHRLKDEQEDTITRRPRCA
jgi:hypothetical protein